jgi:23S rRNA pseudouridine2605 synthase
MGSRLKARGAGRLAAHVSLARALSKLGAASRSEAIALIRDGRVAVDGRVVRSPSYVVVPERAAIEVDGRRVHRERPVTILLHKPRGTVSTARDPRGRPTVLSLVSDAPARVLPVGRLDMATTGLLLLTNDSRFADWVTDPASQVPRTYVVTVRGALEDRTRAQVERGIEVDGELLRPASVGIRKRSGRETHLTITLTEGRNREIRRLMQAVGHEVTRLKRIGFGGLTLGNLAPGKWRVVSEAELDAAFPGRPSHK